MAPGTEALASGTSLSKGVGTKLSGLSPLTPHFRDATEKKGGPGAEARRVGTERGRGSEVGVPRRPAPPRRLTKAKEAHQQQHQEPVRQTTRVAEGRQRPGGGRAISTSLVRAVCQKPPRFLIFLLHRAGWRRRSESRCNSGAGPEPSRDSGHVTATGHVRLRQVTQGRAHAITWWAGLRGGPVFWSVVSGQSCLRGLRSFKRPPSAFQRSPRCPFVS